MEPVEIREFRNRIGRAVRKLRNEEGISAQYLAKVLGVTQPTISRIESGAASLSAENLCFLARSFNRPIAYFIGEQSPVAYDEEDIIRAGLVHYGATHLTAKRTIDVSDYYRSYAELLNAALPEVDDPRIASALATTLYVQAAHNKLKPLRIVTTVTNERLVNHLVLLIRALFAAFPSVDRPSSELTRAKRLLSRIEGELAKGHDIALGAESDVTLSRGIAGFINASIGHG